MDANRTHDERVVRARERVEERAVVWRLRRMQSCRTELADDQNPHADVLDQRVPVGARSESAVLDRPASKLIAGVHPRSRLALTFENCWRFHIAWLL